MSVHEPVLLKEVIKGLSIHKDGIYIDATLGAGGHSAEIIKKGGFVLGIDADVKSIEIAKNVLSKACLRRQACPVPDSVGDCFKIVHGNFNKLESIAHAHKINRADGILFDLGVASMHFDDPLRGFSFKNADAPLDMRLDTVNQALKASDLLNTLRKDQLETMLEKVYSKRKSKELAQKVVKEREYGQFEKIGDLRRLIKIGPKHTRVHPHTKLLLSLRIAVNSEFENLSEALPQALSLLVKGGSLAVITFNSSEEAVVKKELENLKPILPSLEEINKNKKARSAKLWIAEKN